MNLIIFILRRHESHDIVLFIWGKNGKVLQWFSTFSRRDGPPHPILMIIIIIINHNITTGDSPICWSIPQVTTVKMADLRAHKAIGYFRRVPTPGLRTTAHPRGANAIVYFQSPGRVPTYGLRTTISHHCILNDILALQIIQRQITRKSTTITSLNSLVTALTQSSRSKATSASVLKDLASFHASQQSVAAPI